MEVSIDGSPRLPAYAVLPEGADRGVVVVHEIFGRRPEIEAAADRFAEAGYAAVAPDLFAEGWRCVVRSMRLATTGRGPEFDKLRRARAWLEESAGLAPGRVGIIGFCIGGSFALAAGPGWAVASANYGFVPDADALREGGPVIGCYGGRDPMMPREPDKLRRALDEVGRPGEVHVFPDAGHSFLTEDTHLLARTVGPLTRMSYHPAAASEAWPRILAFFDAALPRGAG